MRHFLLSILLFTLLGCSSTSDGRTQVKFLDNEALAQKGAETFAKMKEQVPITQDAQKQAYVQCVADALTQLVPDSVFSGTWEVVVFDAKDINAFALPGGKIGIFNGILNVAQTPDQLAAIIGHEIAHVVLDHSNERASQQMLSKGIGMLGQFAMDIAGVDRSTQRLALNGYGLLSDLGVLKPFSRLHESEADEEGLVLLVQAGYSPYAAVELWQNMAKANEGKAPPEFLSTHPANETRVKNLQKAIKRVVKANPKPRKAPKCKR